MDEIRLTTLYIPTLAIAIAVAGRAYFTALLPIQLSIIIRKNNSQKVEADKKLKKIKIN